MHRLLAALTGLILLLAASRAAATETVKVVLPDADNLQYMSFWLAKAAGLFHEEGVDVELVVPGSPAMTPELVKKEAGQAFVLPPPMYLELIADKRPIVLVANLLQNDPINLIVRRSVAEERGLAATGAVGDRLRGLSGLRVGVAPNPPRRLRALFAAYGLDADKDIEMRIFRGPDQNAAFAEGKVDALYAHTPYVETALVDQDAVMLVNQSAGDVPQLATRQIHALAVTRAFRDRRPDLVMAMTRAIYRAQKLVHDDAGKAAAALSHEFPAMDPRHISKIVSIYAPAIPRTPRVSVDGLQPALALFPATHEPPDISGVKLEEYVDPTYAETVTIDRDRARAAPRALAVAGLTSFAVVLGLALGLYWSRRRGALIARRVAKTTAT
jgi:ABC-type nitrate/sulfonate/bicarbonate transport system substrate-binding protein